MIAHIQYLFRDDILKLAQVNYKTRFGIWYARYRNFESIIMAMPVFIVTLAIHSFIPLIGFRWVMKPVSCIKMSFSCNVDQGNRDYFLKSSQNNQFTRAVYKRTVLKYKVI